MKVSYEDVSYFVNVGSSMERHLIKLAIKKKFFRRYHQDSYLALAFKKLSTFDSPTVVDVGANIGTTLLPLAKQFPKGRFYAVEPYPPAASRLMQNCKANGIHNVKIVSVAIDASEGICQLFTCPTNSGGHRISGFEGRIEGKHLAGSFHIPTLSLEALFNYFHLSVCDLLKIDVEGHECHVLDSLGNYFNPQTIKTIVAECGPEGLRAVGKTEWDLAYMGLAQGYGCHLLDSGKEILHKEDLPAIPDFTVKDFVFDS